MNGTTPTPDPRGQQVPELPALNLAGLNLVDYAVYVRKLSSGGPLDFSCTLAGLLAQIQVFVATNKPNLRSFAPDAPYQIAFLLGAVTPGDNQGAIYFTETSTDLDNNEDRIRPDSYQGLVWFRFLSAFSTPTPATPLIITQPQNQTVTVGTSVSFFVTATGAGTLMYQWQKNGASLTGKTASTLILASVTSGDSGAYRCIVTNLHGSTPSDAANLTVTTAAVFPVYCGNAGTGAPTSYVAADIKGMSNTFGNPVNMAAPEGTYQISATSGGANEYRIIAIPFSKIHHTLTFTAGATPLTMNLVQTNCAIDGADYYIYRTATRSVGAFSTATANAIQIT